MISDTSPRPDLTEPGTFRPEAPAKPEGSRRPWALLTGNDLAAPADARTETLYGLRGEPVADEGAAAARSVEAGGLTTYFVKAGSFGQDRGQLLDPKGVYFDEKDLRRDVKAAGRARYEYKEVTPEVFGDYLDYLKTRKTTLLRRAERGASRG